MILDNEAQVLAATPFDLEAVRPGPGQPINCYATGAPATLITILSEDDDGAGAPVGAPVACTTATIGPNGYVNFQLPSNTLQWITSDAEMWIVLEGVQTND